MEVTHTPTEIAAMIERGSAMSRGSWGSSGAHSLCGELAAMLLDVAADRDALAVAIKKQAAAVRSLQANEATEINMLREKTRSAHVAVATLDSERAANARLTEELEAAGAERDRLAAMVEKLRSTLSEIRG